MIARLFDPARTDRDANDDGRTDETKPTDGATLTEVVEWIARQGLISSKARTLGEYRTTAAYWDSLVRVPLGRIGTLEVSRFVSRLGELDGRKPGETIANNTIRKHYRQLSTILDAAVEGKILEAKHGRPRGLPREEDPIVEAIGFEQFERLVWATAKAKAPQLPGLPASLWWKCLLLYLYYTGVRIQHARGLRWSHVDRDGGVIRAPREIQKGTKRKEIPIPRMLGPALDDLHDHRRWAQDIPKDLQPTCLAERAAVLDASQLVFPWFGLRPWKGTRCRPMCEHHLYRQFHALQDVAEIRSPRGAYFGFHAIRRAHGSLLASVSSDSVAAASLGHRPEVFRKHYDAGMVARMSAAVDLLPRPATRPPERPASGLLPGFDPPSKD